MQIKVLHLQAVLRCQMQTMRAANAVQSDTLMHVCRPGHSNVSNEEAS